MRKTQAMIGSVLALGACASTAAGVADRPGAPIEVHLLAINDFHGNLEPPSNGARIFNYADPTKPTYVPAGGSPRLASAVAELSKQPNAIMVAAGDLIGASPLLSSLFHDEPTIEAMSHMGLALTAVGNHEFDEGWRELRRMQDGGCHPVDGCKGPAPFKGAQFKYLAASTYLDTGETLFPPYAIREFSGVKVGFIGLTLEGTPDVITPAAREGLTFKDEAETVNAVVPRLQALGVESIVVLIHEGGYSGEGVDDCHGLTGVISDIVRQFDKAVDVVVTGHTNGIYICTVDGRLVTGAGAYGTRITDIKMMIDARSGDVIGKSARDIPIALTAFVEDKAQVELIASYKVKAAGLMSRSVGRITSAISRTRSDAGESALGDLVADAMLEAARRYAGAVDIAFMNPGGIRSDLPFNGEGEVTYSDIFTVQPFGNELVALTLTGADIEVLLEQQYQASGNHILQVSDGFAFTWGQAPGQPIEIVPGSVKLNGRPLTADRAYRVVTNNFLLGGGDGFTGFNAGTDRVTVGRDVDAFEDYLKAHSPITGAIKGRITRRQ
jgi:5'-nucleotidase